MNYLLFVYYDETIENSEDKTNEIATLISENLASGNVKFIYGSKHAIFHFDAKGPIEDTQDILFFINEEIGGFEYFLTKKPTTIVSNLDGDNLNEFLSLKMATPKRRKLRIPKKDTDPTDEKGFFDISKLLISLKRKDVCNLTLDELLDKISENGMESLTDLEKQKLDDYSNSL